ncbi:MAG TPA: C45 family autoproteolytic acyltransferase/hydrolase [Bacteroidia bacterium]|nr:C45 family autoproteolytic acyltransferase/hydrolase [Bacteroidia bacterium]
MRKLRKIVLRTLLVFIILLVGFFIYFIIAVQIDVPEIKNDTTLNWKRETIDKEFYKVNNNWLRHHKSGLWELYVEGNGYERGIANGMLTKELHDFQEESFFKQIQILVPDLNYLKFLKYFVGYFNRHLPDHIIDEYKEEILGISKYASDKYDFIAPKYHRILNYHGAHDIGHALQDKNMVVGCTSFSVWDKKSADGKLLVGRNFDFYSGDDFAKNKIVQFTNPTKGNKFATVTWSGFIGACSGMNDKGLTVTINAAKSSIPTDAATPIALLAREILQYASNIKEAIEIAKKRDVFVSESILIGSAFDNKTISIEKSPTKMDVYEVPNSNQIICPNHYQGPDYQNDIANLTNQIESSSLYRSIRLKQLLSNSDTINYTQAASILRNQKGLNDQNIGMTNEKSLNQLLAHHAVIFKPQDRLMWVSANPFQCGEFVCYNLDSVFAKVKTINTQQDINVAALTIAADPFLKTEAYQNFLHFKNLKHYIQFITKASDKIVLSPQFENAFIQSNPESYYMYQILGNYYASRKNNAKAIEYYNKALTKEIATLKEERQIKESIEAIKINR